MNRRFTVDIERKQDEYEARCREMPDAVARGCSKKDAIEKIGAVMAKMLEDGSDDGTAPKPHPVSPSPRGPTIVQESHEKPDANSPHALDGGIALQFHISHHWPAACDVRR